jgi:hypothetical protein
LQLELNPSDYSPVEMKYSPLVSNPLSCLKVNLFYVDICNIKMLSRNRIDTVRPYDFVRFFTSGNEYARGVGP